MTTLSSYLAGLSVLPANVTQAYALVYGSDGNLYRAPATRPGLIPYLNVTGSRLLTLADTQAGPLLPTSSGTTIMTIPTNYQLGYIWDANNPVGISWEFKLINPTGILQLVVAQYRGRVASQAAMLALSGASQPFPGDWCCRTDIAAAGQPGTYFYLASGASTVAGNWVQCTMSAANIPSENPIGLGGISTYDPQYLATTDPTVSIDSLGADNYVMG